MAIAIGRTKESELKEDLYKVSQCLRGRRGLLFSNESLDGVRAWFKKHSPITFARYYASKHLHHSRPSASPICFGGIKAN